MLIKIIEFRAIEPNMDLIDCSSILRNKAILNKLNDNLNCQRRRLLSTDINERLRILSALWSEMDELSNRVRNGSVANNTDQSSAVNAAPLIQWSPEEKEKNMAEFMKVFNEPIPESFTKSDGTRYEFRYK